MMLLIEKLKLYGLKKSGRYAVNEFLYKYKNLLQKSYGQKGEDVIIDRLLNYKQTGFYVDIGANDPVRFSNTKRFYDRGWTGINIEPDPAPFERLRKARPKDINLNIGIGERKGITTFYRFFPNTLSTFSKHEAVKFRQEGYKLIGKTKVEINTLANVLNKYADGRKIDFFSIDTEGFEMQVLNSNDWRRFVPKVICVESSRLDRCFQTEKIVSFAEGASYKKVFDNSLNFIYLLEG